MATIDRRAFIGGALGSAALAGRDPASAAMSTRRPNVVLLLADDLGWGDIGVYNAAASTPHLDRLAGQSTRFTDMHSSSAVCTPSRYSILTGRYPWRSRLKKGVLGGDSPALIEPGRLTLPGMLKRAGYYTAGIGKWHLGLGDQSRTDFTKPFHPAPTDVGFDYYFGIPASLDIPPFLFFENDHALAAPTAQTAGHPQDASGAFWRAGPMMPGFDLPQVLPTLTTKAVDIVRQHAVDRTRPYFLYVPLSAPHQPWLPLPAYRGKSRAGPYGDYVYETDAMIGQVLDAIEGTGTADNTIVIFASDNGAFWNKENIARYSYYANADWRGQKADIWEAGHRIPCMIRWPGHVPASAVSPTVACLTDVMATIAAAVKLALPTDAAEDSFDLLPGLERRAGAPARPPVIDESNDGMLAVRDGRWKLTNALGSGGFTAPKRIQPQPDGPEGQLYDLIADPGEQNNLWDRRPDIVARLSAILQQAQDNGRTRSRH